MAEGLDQLPCVLSRYAGRGRGPDRETELIEQWNARASDNHRPPWMKSLIVTPAHDENGQTIGVQWLILTPTEEFDQLPPDMEEVAWDLLKDSAEPPESQPD